MNEVLAFPKNTNGAAPVDGLTKREYFAGLAMQGMLSGHLGSGACSMTPQDCAEDSLLFADALLVELHKK